MFQLTGKVGLDASGFYRSLTGMKAAAAPLGNQIAKQLGSRFMAYFGAGAFVNEFRKTLAGAFEIRKEAGKLGLDTSTFQTLAKLADETGASMEKMVEKLHGNEGFAQAVRDANTELLETGKIIQEDTIKRLAEVQDKLNDLTARKAVVVAQISEVAIGAYEWYQKNAVENAVGLGSMLYGLITGQREWDTAGREMTGLDPSTDPTDPAGTGTKSAYQRLVPLVKALGDGTAEGVAKALKDPTVKEERRQDGMKSGDETWGRYFGKGPGLTPVENQLRLLNRTVYDMNRKLGNVL